MVSMIGMGRGTTHGSSRPLAFSFVVSVKSPLKSAVGCALPMVAGGLYATRSRKGIPLEMSPWMPPEQLAMVNI